jgi:O-antigen/teichoic acid export membrane protein
MARRIRNNRVGPGLARRSFARLLGSLQVPVYRSSYALLATTVANAVLGLLFWVVAARLYPARVVGLGAGGISALQLVAAVGWVGLQFTLLRYVPVAGAARRRLVGLVYASGVGVAVLGGLIFTLALARTLEVPYLSSGWATMIAFWGSVAVWVVFSLQDAVLVGIRRSLLVPVENAAYGTLKLILLVALSTLSDPWTLLAVWAGAAGVVAAVINGMLFRRLLHADPRPPAMPPAQRLARFSAGQTAVALSAWVPDFLVPLLVLRFLNEEANAYYYAAWTVGFSTRLLAVNIGNALTVEGAYAEVPIRALLRSVVGLCTAVLVPVIVVMLLGAKQILSVFGPDYADAGAPLLRYFALSLVPFTIATLVVAVDRIRERSGAAFVITASGTATTLALDIVLIPAQGITGAGIGWLGGQATAAAVALASLRRTST